MGYEGARTLHPGQRRPRRFAVLGLLLLTLSAPAGMVIAGEPSAAYVVLFREDAVTVPSQALDPATNGGRSLFAPSPGTGDDALVVDAARVASHVRELAARTGMRTVDDVYTNAVGGFSARLTPSQLRAISADPAVGAVVPDTPVSLGPEIAGEAAGGVRTTGNPSERVQPGVRRVGARSARTIGLTSRGGKVNADVAILDTGIDRDHTDLNVVGGYNCTGRDRARWDDANGHGTHVAGIVGALDNRFGVTGVAPGARLWSVKVLDRNGRGFLSWLVCGIDWVTAQRDRGGRPLIEVANMSLSFRLPGANDAGCGEPSNDSLHLAICRSIEKGTVYVAAAGNESRNARRNRPAAYDQVITVSAMADYDGRGGGRGQPSDSCPYWSPEADDAFANFSNFGADVDLIAPGRCVLSTYMRNRYAWMSGTSMATPHVAGAAALYRSMYPRATPQQVRMALQAVGKLDWRTATDRDRTHEKSLWIGEFRAAPDFAISASLGSAVVPPGGEFKLDVALRRVGGFDSPVNVTLANPVRGISASQATTRRGNAQLTVRLADSIRAGRYTLTVDATGAGLVRTATITIIVRGGAPQASFTSPRPGITVSAATDVTVSWTERTGGAAISERRLARESGRIRTPGTCDGVAFSADVVRNRTTGVTERLRPGSCYRWQLTVVDATGMRSSGYSGAVLVDTTAPRAPTVTVTAEAARVDVERLGVNEAHVGHSGMLWVRAGVSGSVLVSVEAFDPESGIFGNVAVADPRNGWRATWIGDSADGALRLHYTSRGGATELRVSSINGAGLEGSAAVGRLMRDGAAPVAVRWTSAPSDTTKRIRGTAFRLDWTGGSDQGSGLAAEHVIARYRAGLNANGQCRLNGFSPDGGFRLASNSILETGLEPGGCYVWSVRTLDNVGNSGPSVISGYVIVEPRR